MSSDQARDAYRLGMTTKVVDWLRNKGDATNASRSIVQASQALEDKLRVVFGNQNLFDQYMGRVGAERNLSKLEGAIGNSETAMRLSRQSAPDLTEQLMDIHPLTLLHGPSGLVAQTLHAAEKASKSARGRATAAQMMPMLMKKGPSEIAQLLQELYSKPTAPAMSGMVSQGLPAVSGRIPELLGLLQRNQDDQQ